MAVALIDYGAGNLRSAAKALESAGAMRVIVTSKPADVLAARAVVLPGVGAFGSCARALRAIPGMEEALNHAILADRRPFLGICIGMQLMAQESEEFGRHRGLGWIAGTVRRMEPDGLHVPQIGWNEVCPTFPGLIEPGYAYFVHSYEVTECTAVAATTDYGSPVTAAVLRENMLGVQFHPEKSQSYGISLLSRWLKWRP